MAKSFNKLKTSLGLLDFIPIGKYKQCRVDSIAEQDPDYLIFMDKEKIIRFSPEVIEKLRIAYNGEATIPRDTECSLEDLDDIPF